MNDLCPSCGLADDWKQNPLKPYCSEVCRLLWRYGLGWQIHPYRIIVNGHPHLIVQPGPRFDLRESALKGARDRALETNRKSRQRVAAKVRIVPPTARYNAPIGESFSILGVQDHAEVNNYGK